MNQPQLSSDANRDAEHLISRDMGLGQDQEGCLRKQKVLRSLCHNGPEINVVDEA